MHYFFMMVYCVLAPLRVSWCSSLWCKYSSPKFLLCFSCSACSDNSYHLEQNITAQFIQESGGPYFDLPFDGTWNKKGTIFHKWLYSKEKCVLYPPQKLVWFLTTCNLFLLLMLPDLITKMQAPWGDRIFLMRFVQQHLQHLELWAHNRFSKV